MIYVISNQITLKKKSKSRFRAHWQHSIIDSHIKELPIPLGKVIMVLDFAENFACFGQNEVQAAYWQREQVITV